MTWAGVQRPTNADAVALFFAGDDPNQRTPLKFKWAFASKSHIQTGSGSHTCAHKPALQHLQSLFSPLGPLFLVPQLLVESRMPRIYRYTRSLALKTSLIAST